MTAFDFQPEFRKTLLSNGARVVTEHHPFSRSTAASIYVDLGTRDEAPRINGAAHFIEHLVFKGTLKRSAFAIAKSLEAVGGDLNAYTSRELTCFHTLSLREHLPLGLDVLGDLVTGAVFDQRDFLKEKEVIFQEISMSAEEIEEYIFDQFLERVYADQSLGMPILGSRESLGRISRRALNDFYRTNYLGSNLIVSVAGDVDHDRVLEIVDQSIGKRKSRSMIKRPRRSRPSQRTFMEVIARPSEQIHMLLGFPSGSFKDPLRFESYIVNAVLGGGMTSRLYQRVRESRGLVYSIYSHLQAFSDSGLLMIYAGASEKNAPKVLKIIARELVRLNREGLTQRELNFFKTQVKGTILLGSDDVESRMNSIAVNEMIFGRYRPIESVIEEIDRVTLKSIGEYIDRFLPLKKLSVMLMGDLNNERGINWIEDAFPNR